MPNQAHAVGGVRSYLGYLTKDVGARLGIWAHYLRSARRPVPVMRHQPVRAYRGLLPVTEDCAFIAPSAFLTGNVVMGHDTCVFYHSVVRNYHSLKVTEIGDRTVLLDNSTVMGQVKIGCRTVVGIGASLDCCEVGDDVYIGHGASIALGSVLENGCIVAAGAAIPKDTRVYSGELWAGNPAQKVADITPDMIEKVHTQREGHIRNGRAHTQAILQQYESTEHLTLEWMKGAMEGMEAQQRQMATPHKVEIPLEARRFLQPRVYSRRPELHHRTSYPVNRVAPWLPRAPDQIANV